MNNKIIIIATIVFALIFVVLLATFMGTLMNKGETANVKLIDTMDGVDTTSLSAYEGGTQIKGESVIGAIKNVKALGGQYKIVIAVNTKASNGKTLTNAKSQIGVGAGGYWADATTQNNGYYDIDHQYTVKASDSSNAEFINPDATFSSTVEKNDNGVILGIVFTQDT